MIVDGKRFVTPVDVKRLPDPPAAHAFCEQCFDPVTWEQYESWRKYGKKYGPFCGEQCRTLFRGLEVEPEPSMEMPDFD